MGDTWSKDFVEHLRTVHFALVTFSITLIVLVSSTSRLEYSKAQAQITALGNVNATLIKTITNSVWESQHPKTIDTPRETIDTSNSKASPEQETLSKACNRTNGSPTFCKVFYFRWLTFQIGSVEVNLDMDAEQGINSDGFLIDPSKSFAENYPPGTFAGVKRLWNFIAPGRSVKTIGNLTDFEATIDNQPATILVQANSSAHILPTIVLHVEPPLSNKNLKPGDGLQLSGIQKVDKQEIKVVIKSTVETVRVSPSDVDAARDLFHGSAFDSEFPEAARFVRNRDLANSRLDEIASRIHSAEEKGESPATVFGISIFPDVIRPWGMFLLVCIQLYFWIHVIEIGNRIRPDGAGWEVAWIGIYDREFANVLFVFSACIIPPIALIISMFLEFKEYFGSITNIETTALVVMTLGGISLGWFTYERVRALHRQRRDFIDNRADNQRIAV